MQCRITICAYLTQIGIMHNFLDPSTRVESSSCTFMFCKSITQKFALGDDLNHDGQAIACHPTRHREQLTCLS